MDIQYDKQKLSAILADVYQLLHTPISVFDGNFQYLTAYPANGELTEYCHLIRQAPERFRQCMASDKTACAHCREKNQPYSYRCHAGVYETVTPILFENRIIGYLMFGEYRRAETDTGETGEAGERFVREYARQNGMEEEAVVRAYNCLTVLTEKQVEATVHILQSCILRFWLSEAILWRENKTVEEIKDFVDNNLSAPLTAQVLCRKFGINRQRLYALFRNNFNKTVKEYVLDKRIAYAKSLLRTTTLSITEIAERAGFGDYSHFIQRFKKETGQTPLRYRNAREQAPLIVTNYRDTEI